MRAVFPSWQRHRLHVTELVLFLVVAAVLIGVDLLFYFWPFRYRQVMPLLQTTFESRVVVKRYYRTYFPHPGFVAEGVTFYRHGDMKIPPLASMDSMTVAGTWTNLMFHPHTLYEIRLQGLHVQIPPPGSRARGMDFDGSMLSPSQHEMVVETIVADNTVLDFLDRGHAPLHLAFAALQIHNVRAGSPLGFYAQVAIPKPQGTLVASGSLGPFQTSHFRATQVSGRFTLLRGNLSCVSGLEGHMDANGEYHGTLENLQVAGKATSADFRVASAHRTHLDAAYQVTVSGTNGDVQIRSAQVRTGESTIDASGSVTGSPRVVAVQLSTNRGDLEHLLEIIEQETPTVAGKVSFQAAAQFTCGQGAFLQKLQLKGKASVQDVRFVKADKQTEMDAFSARVQAKSAGDPPDDPVEVTANAWSDTTIQNGIANFPDIHVNLPGAQARLHGTFNLLSSKVDLTGRAALERNISHAVTGWKSVLLKPLAPIFRKKDAGAVVSIAVTGTADQPKIGQDLMHDK